MLQYDSISPIKYIKKFRTNIFFFILINNNYNIYINKYISISFAILSRIGFAFIFKNLFLL